MSTRKRKMTKEVRAERRAQAQARQAEYDKLSLEEKLAKLPVDGAKKQRAKLTALLEAQNKKAAEKKESGKTAKKAG